MNRTIHALFTTLKWKLQGVCNTLILINQQIMEVEHELQMNQQKTNESSVLCTSIIPEHEMARSHFFILQQQRQDELAMNKTALLSEQQALVNQQTDLNRELKKLEKHQNATLKRNQKHAIRKHQNDSDEWGLQRKEPYENSYVQQLVLNGDPQ